MARKTRIVRLSTGARRERERNEGTCVVRVVRPPGPDIGTLFNALQGRFHEALAEQSRAGVQVFAVSDEGHLAGQMWLVASPAPRSGSLGRHDAVDLYLPDAAGELSLRACVVVVRQVGTQVRTRVIDLLSTNGFTLDDASLCRAVESDGPFFLKVPQYTLFFFGTGTPPPWDDRAKNPFASLPPRRLHRITRPAPSRRPPGERDYVTNVTTLRNPARGSREELLAPGEVPEGRLVLSSQGEEEELPAGSLALERGVLLGRADRCCGRLRLSLGVSRVHALVLRLDDALLLIDAGSRNGTWCGREEIRCAPLETDVEYQLADENGATVRWKPSH